MNKETFEALERLLNLIEGQGLDTDQLADFQKVKDWLEEHRKEIEE